MGDNTVRILSIVPVFKAGLLASLENITENHLNHVFADHKMTIGQIAVHCTAWARYFLTEIIYNEKPWEVVPRTCKPCEYPLTLDFVRATIDDGFQALTETLQMVSDEELEVYNDRKGPGYIICRLLLHALTHSNQMAYLRQLLDKDWGFGTHFGDMATAFINLDYHTTRDLTIPGF